MAGNLQLSGRGDFSRATRENGGSFQGLRTLHGSTRRHPKRRRTGRGRKGVSDSRRVQPTALQEASETPVNLRPDRWNPKRIGDILVVHVHPQLPIPLFVSPPDIHIAISATNRFAAVL